MTFDTEVTSFGPKLRANKHNNVLEALSTTTRDAMVLIHRLDDGRVHVSISYGDERRDGPVRESFDEAEWGCAPTLIEALRYALGVHFHVEPE